MSNVPDPASEGLRARKRRATRAAIQQAALSLFLSKGYDETTTQEIARAADVSPGTLFNYFPTKEDLVADDYDPLFLDLLAARPLDEPPFVAIRKALQAGLEAVLAEDRAFLVARGRLALAAPALRAGGIAVQAVPVKPDFSHGKHIGVEAAGNAGFARLAASGRLSPDTVVFVTDDYLARGALSAMLAAGLHPPEDFRLAVWANAGLGPFFPRELSRMETDPRAAGTAAAAAAIAYLETGRYPSDTAIRPRWFPGETMGALLPPEGSRKPPEAIDGHRQ